MESEKRKIRLDHSRVVSVTQHDGNFEIVIEGNRKNRKGNYEYYEIRLHGVDHWWLSGFLTKAQEKISDYKDSVVEFATRFGV